MRAWLSPGYGSGHLEGISKLELGLWVGAWAPLEEQRSRRFLAHRPDSSVKAGREAADLAFREAQPEA